MEVLVFEKLDFTKIQGQNGSKVKNSFNMVDKNLNKNAVQSDFSYYLLNTMNFTFLDEKNLHRTLLF